MSRLITYKSAFDNFKELIGDSIPEDDETMRSEEWNNYTDSLCKDGELTDLEYHYCPSVDFGPMPDDDESMLEFILNEMGVGFHRGSRQSTRNDGMMSDSPNHFRCAISRGNQTFETCFSQGSGIKESPELLDVLPCLFMDITGIDQTFEEWANEIGYDEDSRKAERIYEACKETLTWLKMLFTDSEISDLQERISEAGL